MSSLFRPVGFGPIARLAAVYGVIYLAVQSVIGPDSLLGRFVSQAGFLPLSAVTTWAFLRASRNGTDGASRTGFGAYAVSFGLTAAGTLLTGLLQAAHLPSGHLPDALYLLSYPAAAIGVLSFRAERSGPAVRLRLAIDTAIAVIAAAMLTWLYILEPRVGTDRGLVDQLVLLAYPIGDLVLFVSLVPILLAPRQPQAAAILRLLATAQMTYLAGDMVYQLGALIPTWVPDVTYLTGYVGMIWAAEGYARAPVAGLNAPPESGAIVGRNRLPVLLGAAIYALLLGAALGSGASSIALLTVTVGLLSALILIRERLSERQAVALTRELEADRNAARFRAAIAHLKVGIAIIGPDGRPSVANPAAADLLHLDGPDGGNGNGSPGLTSEDGQPLGPEAHPAALARATGRPVRDQVIGVHPPGHPRRRWLLVDADPIAAHGEPVREVILSLHDITDRRLLEEQLRHTQRMEAIGKLAGGIAHDFNNLLTAIIGHSDILKRKLGPTDQRSDDVAGIRQAADRAARLTRQLLAFSRRQHLVPEVLDLNDVVRDTERLLIRLLGEDIAIVMDLHDGPITIRVDRGQLEQVIVNLALNARDAMPRGGELTIITRHLDGPGADLPGTFVGGDAGAALLRIADVGDGMDETTRRRAFEPFFTTKEFGKGTGLGLATVYGIVQQSGGEVTLDSAPGAGTRVSVFLPATVPPPPPSPTATPLPLPRAATPPAERVVLVVEDEAALREVIRRSLAERGYRVLVAAGLSTARAILESSATVDLLLTDVVMPDGNGPELAAWVRTVRPTLPVLLMTGYADDQVLRYNLDPAATDLIQKPFDPTYLVERIAARIDP